MQMLIRSVLGLDLCIFQKKLISKILSGRLPLQNVTIDEYLDKKTRYREIFD